MNFNFLAATTFALVVAIPASAQDKSPSGPRIELRGGFDHTSLNIEATDGTTSEDISGGKDSVAYGVEAGYDITVNHLLLGSYLGFAGSSTKECTEFYGDDEACLKAGRDLTLGVRFGYVTNGGIAIYGKGGYSNGRLNVQYDDFVDNDYDFKTSTKMEGFHLGAGVEMPIGSSGIYGKLEYVYTDYNVGKIVEDDYALGVGFDRHQVLAGAGFRF